MSDMEKHVEAMVVKAANAKTSDEAMKFSQAAENAAHALQTLVRTQIDKKQVANG